MVTTESAVAPGDGLLFHVMPVSAQLVGCIVSEHARGPKDRERT